MTQAGHAVDWRRFDAVLFDLDGVLTQTAAVHATCWKQMFDDYLRQRAAATHEPFRPFEPTDYIRYVDGKPRYHGVRDFLRSRGIHLPEGTPDDLPDHETICGLGNRKSALFLDLLVSEGIETYEGSVALVRRLRDSHVKTAVVSSSKNCSAILQAAGIIDLFDLQIDGEVATRRGLPGKPAPDTFLEAARALGVEPRRTAVIEDAIAGVEAGRAGRFGLVIGVDRHGDAAALRAAGADVVVRDLAEPLWMGQDRET